MATRRLTLSPEASAILSAVRQRGTVGNAHRIARLPLPRSEWWKVVSRGARADEPYFNTVRDLIILRAKDPRVPAWPPGLYEEEESLPPVSREEALAILALFMRLEGRGVAAGVQLYLLHWDVLAAQYCPLRERYAVIRELTASGLLVQASEGAHHVESNARWPLHLSETGARAVRQARLAAHLPTFVRIEDWLREMKESFPLLVNAVSLLLLGGGAVKFFDWLFGA